MADNVWQLIDREATLARLANDQSLFDELVGFFLEDHGPVMATLASAVATQDAASLERSAHSLKGMAANLGATAVSGAAAALETMGRQRNLEGAMDAEITLKNEIQRLVSALQNYRSGQQ